MNTRLRALMRGVLVLGAVRAIAQPPPLASASEVKSLSTIFHMKLIESGKVFGADGREIDFQADSGCVRQCTHLCRPGEARRLRQRGMGKEVAG
jgi:hypothetical protein